MVMKEALIKELLVDILNQNGQKILDNKIYSRNLLRDKFGKDYPEEAACLSAIALAGYPNELLLFSSNTEVNFSKNLDTAVRKSLSSHFSDERLEQCLDIWKSAMNHVYPPAIEAEEVEIDIEPKPSIELTVMAKPSTNELINSYETTPVPYVPNPNTGNTKQIVIAIVVGIGMMGLVVFFSKTPSPTQPTQQEAELKAKAMELEQQKLKLEQDKLKLEQDKLKIAAKKNQENNVNQNGSTGRYPQTMSRNISSDELQGMDCTSLWQMRNEIYARHGRIFQTPEISNYFSSQSWYKPNSNYSDSQVSLLEQQNAVLIMSYEKGQGCM